MITAMPRIAVAVEDFEAAVHTFREKLGLPVIDVSRLEEVAHLGARIAMCVPPGGSNIEIMSPSVPEAPLAKSLQGLLDRRGEGLFAMMMEAPDPDREAALIEARGLRVLPLMAGSWGRDIHPSSTHGVLIRIYPDNSFEKTAPTPADGLGLSGIRRVAVLVRDIDRARACYAEGLGLQVSLPEDGPARGLRRAVVRPPGGGLIDLITVVDAGPPDAADAQRILDTRGEGMWELTLDVPDLEQLAEKLTSRGLFFKRSSTAQQALLLAPAQTFGMRLRIVES